MAMVNPDGTIILKTTVDTNGLNKGVTSIKDSVKMLSGSMTRLSGLIATAFSTYALISFSKASAQLATNAEANAQRIIDIYGQASNQISEFINQNARALGMSKVAASQFASVYGNLFSVWADQATNANLTTHYLNMTAVVASKTGRTVEDVQERIRSGLLGNTEAVEDLGVFVNIKTIEMTEAFQRIADGRSWEKLTAYEQAQVRSLAILEQATNKYGTTVAQNNAFTRAQYAAAFEDFKATWGQCVNLILIPVLKIVTRILNTLVAGLRLIAGLSGETSNANTQLETQSDLIGSSVDNQHDLTDAVKETAKEQKKLLAGFDDLEILSQNATSSAGALSPNVGGAGGLSTDIKPFEIDGDLDIAQYESKLSALAGMMVGAALVGLGVVMLCSGHVVVGVTMIAAGYVLEKGALENVDKLGEEEKRKLRRIGLVTGAALLGLGTLLLFTKKYWKYGLGMVASGAMTLYELQELGLFSEKDKVTDLILDIIALVGTVLIILGILVLFTGVATWKFGLKMIATGAAQVTIPAVINWDEIKKTVSDFFDDNWGAILALSVGLFVLGIILLCIPGCHLYGLTLLGLGIVGLYGTTAANWDEIKKIVSKFFDNNWKAILALSVGLFVLGIILLCIPGSCWYGLTLLGLGIVGLYGPTIANWTKIKGEIKEFLRDNKDTIAKFAAGMFAIGVILLFTPAWGVGLTMIAGSAGSFWAASSLGDFGLEKALKSKLSGMTNYVSSLPGMIQGLIQIKKTPGLATGAVLPANKPFLAVVGDQKHGTNIEAPAALIKQMAKEAIAESSINSQPTGIAKEEHYYLNETELMSIVYRLTKGGERLAGASFIEGGVV